ncbi:MAG: ribosome silencing factor [Thiotrichales bacterium]
MELNQLKTLVEETLDEMKAQDVKSIDVQGITSITDLIYVATGTSTRHVKSIIDRIVERAKDAGVLPLGTEGEQSMEWMLVDLNDVVVHVMLQQTRDFYNLEKLWETRVDSRVTRLTAQG